MLIDDQGLIWTSMYENLSGSVYAIIRQKKDCMGMSSQKSNFLISIKLS